MRAQQTFFSGDERAFAIDVNGATFQYERRAIAIGAFDLTYLTSDQIVLVPRKIQTAADAAPGVEDPVDTTQLTTFVYNERRTHVAHPRIVTGHFHDANRIGKHRASLYELRS